MATTHALVQATTYAATQGGQPRLEVSVWRSTVLAATFLVRLTHTGHYDDDLHAVQLRLGIDSAPTGVWTHANGVNVGTYGGGELVITADHIARAMTLEVRVSTAAGRAPRFTLLEVADQGTPLVAL